MAPPVQATQGSPLVPQTLSLWSVSSTQVELWQHPVGQLRLEQLVDALQVPLLVSQVSDPVQAAQIAPLVPHSASVWVA